MKGRHNIIVRNKKLHYEFEIKRNITVIQGDSATGKTTLIDMLRQYENYGTDSGVSVECDVPCAVLEGREWKIQLENRRGCILFTDEGNSFVKTEEFAKAVRDSDNYFVLITRENLYNLPYSVEEIYGIRSSGKYQNTQRVYQQMYHIYSGKQDSPMRPQEVIVEDSNSGYEFFKSICLENGISCQSAGGKTKIFSKLLNLGDQEICVIADGAALGAEMKTLYDWTQEHENVVLYLPESFEWLLLKSDIISEGDIHNILEKPEEYIQSQLYFSWEQFFTKLLVDRTQDTYLKYQKKKLNEVYLHEKNKKAILKEIKRLRFE